MYTFNIVYQVYVRFKQILTQEFGKENISIKIYKSMILPFKWSSLSTAFFWHKNYAANDKPVADKQPPRPAGSMVCHAISSPEKTLCIIRLGACTSKDRSLRTGNFLAHNSAQNLPSVCRKNVTSSKIFHWNMSKINFSSGLWRLLKPPRQILLAFYRYLVVLGTLLEWIPVKKRACIATILCITTASSNGMNRLRNVSRRNVMRLRHIVTRSDE